MELLAKIFGLVFALIVMWWGYRFYKSNPEQFSKEKLGKSFGTMGMLGLFVIAFVGFLILLLRQ